MFIFFQLYEEAVQSSKICGQFLKKNFILKVACYESHMFGLQSVNIEDPILLIRESQKRLNRFLSDRPFRITLLPYLCIEDFSRIDENGPFFFREFNFKYTLGSARPRGNRTLSDKPDCRVPARRPLRAFSYRRSRW